MISYDDNTLTTTIHRDRFGMPMGDTNAQSASEQSERGLQVKSVVNPHVAFTATGNTTPGNHAWRPPDW